jgi:hypothetical protein
MALPVLGSARGRATSAEPMCNMWQTVLVDGLATTAAFGNATAMG